MKCCKVPGFYSFTVLIMELRVTIYLSKKVVNAGLKIFCLSEFDTYCRFIIGFISGFIT